MSFNLEGGKSKEINETPESKVDNEQLSETEETAESFDDCSLNEVRDCKGNEINAESLEDFSEKIKTMIDGVYKDRNLVVLLDLPGGSPANVSLPFINSSRKFIAGINLPFVLELMAMKKNGISWEELNIEEICENASRSMVFYNKLLDGGNV